MAKVILINGSMNPNSLGKRLLNMVGKVLEKNGHTLEMICVLETNFPLYNPVSSNTDKMNQISELIKSADAFVVASPEYHGGYSGALKNLLDYQDGSGFVNKPIALITTSGGIKAGINSLNSLRLIFRSLHSYVIPQQVAVSEKEINSDRELDKEVKKQLQNVIQGLMQEINLRFSK